jgi:hypothetical protein
VIVTTAFLLNHLAGKVASIVTGTCPPIASNGWGSAFTYFSANGFNLFEQEEKVTIAANVSSGNTYFLLI